MSPDQYGPVALVTGASSGIGWELAQSLARRGFDLVLVARRVDRLDDLAAQLVRSHGIAARTVPLDVARVDAADVVLSACADLDVGLVINNAGFSMKGDHATNDADELTSMLMVNCHAPLQLTRGFIPRLRARGRGGIVLTSSIEALLGCPYSAAYAASKALVKALGEALWAELRPDGIDVLTVCPGATESEAAARVGIDLSTLAHVMKASEVAELILDNLAAGPVLFPSTHYKTLFEQLLAMPREQALLAMANGTRSALATEARG